jgi:hypothetical protein
MRKFRLATIATASVVAITSCSSLPPTGQELARESGVSLVRVADRTPGVPMLATNRDDTGAVAIVANGATLPALTLYLWPDIALENEQDLPEGLYAATIRGATPDEARKRFARALADGFGVTIVEEPRNTTVYHLRALAGATVRSATSPDGQRSQDLSFTKDGARRTIKYRGSSQSFLEALPSFGLAVDAHDATPADALLEVEGAFEDVGQLRTLLQAKGFDLAPETQTRTALCVRNVAAGK